MTKIKIKSFSQSSSYKMNSKKHHAENDLNGDQDEDTQKTRRSKKLKRQESCNASLNISSNINGDTRSSRSADNSLKSNKQVTFYSIYIYTRFGQLSY